MTLQEYQEQAMTTCMDTARNIPYMAMNLQGELLELLEKLNPQQWTHTVEFMQYCDKADGDGSAIAKAIRKGEVDAPTTQEYTAEEKAEVLLEVGDCLWMLSGLLSVMGLSLEDAAAQNLSKLQSRQVRGVVDGNGDHR